MKKVKPSFFVTQMASRMFLGTFCSRLLGLLRDVLLANYFSKSLTDAFVIAFRLPNFFRRILGEGAFSISFIPTYLDQMNQNKHEAFKNAVFSLIFIISLSLTCLGIIFMEDLLSFILSGKSFHLIEGKFELTLFLSRLMFFYLFLVSLFAFFMSILNAHKYFFWPAFAPAIFNFCIIVFILLSYFFPNKLINTSTYLAIGVLVGGFFQALTVFLNLIYKNIGINFSFKFKNTAASQFFIKLLPAVLTLGMMQMMSLMNIYFASFLPEGSHSYIYWADRILELPLSLIAISLGSALLPHLTEFSLKGQKEEFLKLSESHLRFLLFLVLPSSLGMFILASPMVETIFLRGQFSLVDLEKTAEVVRIYSLVLIFSSLYKVLTPHFYAIKKFWWPFWISLCGLSFHAIFAFYFLKTYGLKGLIYSVCIASFLNTSLSFLFYMKKFGIRHLKQSALSFFRWLIPLSLMGVFVFYFYFCLVGFFEGFLLKTLFFLLTVFSGASLYIGLSYFLKIRESYRFLKLLKLIP